MAVDSGIPMSVLLLEPREHLNAMFAVKRIRARHPDDVPME